MTMGRVLTVVALVLAGIVGLAEVGYYMSHPDHSGVAPHLIGLSTAVILLAVSRLIKDRETK
jgi:hypothetical protein